MAETPRSRVFISYSHDSAEHQAQVLGLADRLSQDGLDCALDQYETFPPEGWPQWMDRQLDEADFVLVVCTEGYYRKAKARKHPSAGLGVKFESVLILSDLYNAGMLNERFIPVFFGELPVNRILRPLHGYTRFRVDLEDGYEDLFRHLTDQPRHRKPEPGLRRALPPEPPRNEALLADRSKGPYRCLASRPHSFVPRREYQMILEQLLAGAADLEHRMVGITTALRGAGGFGKTTLAQALCHDPCVQAAYPGGILWLTLGDQLTDGDRLARVRDLLRRWRGCEPPAFETIDNAGGYLRDLLVGERVLVVIDDVWSPLDLVAFRELDPASALLVTTRDRRNLPQGCRAVDVDAMEASEAVELLSAGLPGLPHEHFRSLARRLGGWPLLLSLVHRQILERVNDEEFPPDRALAEVEEILEEEGLEAFDRADVDARELAVSQTLNASLRYLSADERQRYEQLAIFQEDTDIPFQTLGLLWNLPLSSTRAFCRRVYQLSLVVRYDPEAQTIRLHDVFRAYLRGRSRAQLPALHRGFLEAHRPSDQWAALPTAETYLWRHLAYHLVESGLQDELRTLLLDFSWIEAKLAATDINALLADYDALRHDLELRLVQGALRLSAHALVERPEELPGQLVGRLLGRSEPVIANLVKKAQSLAKRLWLRPLTASLLPAGGALVRTLIGHWDEVHYAMALPDSHVVSSSIDGTLRVWDVASGETLKILEGKSNLNRIALLNDGCVLAVADDIIRVWDVASGETVTLEPVEWDWGDITTGDVTAVAALPDGRVVFGCRDYTLRVWDMTTGKSLKVVLKGHSGEIFSIVWLPGGRIVSGSHDRTLRVWDLASGRTIKTLKGHSGGVNAMALLPNGHLVSASYDSTLRVWDLTSGKTLKILSGHLESVDAVILLPDGRLVSASSDRTLKVWDLVSEEILKTLEGHSSWVNAVALLPNGRVVSASGDRTLRVWDLASGETLKARQRHSKEVNQLAVLHGNRVVSASGDGTLRVWDVTSGELLKILEGHAKEVYAVGVLPDDQVVSASGDRTLRVWDLASGKTVKTLEGHLGGIYALTVLADGHVVSASADSTLRVWDLASGESLKTLKGHSKSVHAVVALPDNVVVSASSDCTLRSWDLDSGETLKTLTGHSSSIPSLAALPDGKVISFASRDRILRVWNVESGETLKIFKGHSDQVVALLRDGHVVSTSDDGTLRVWDVATGETLKTLEGHSQRAWTLALLPGRQRLVSGSDDRTLRIWDLASGETLACLTLDAMPTALAALGDCKFVVGDESGQVHFFSLEEPAPE